VINSNWHPLSFFHFVTNLIWRTDGQTEFSSLDRVCIPCSAVKTKRQDLTRSFCKCRAPVHTHTFLRSEPDSLTELSAGYNDTFHYQNWTLGFSIGSANLVLQNCLQKLFMLKNWRLQLSNQTSDRNSPNVSDHAGGKGPWPHFQTKTRFCSNTDHSPWTHTGETNQDCHTWNYNVPSLLKYSLAHHVLAVTVTLPSARQLYQQLQGMISIIKLTFVFKPFPA